MLCSELTQYLIQMTCLKKSSFVIALQLHWRKFKHSYSFYWFLFSKLPSVVSVNEWNTESHQQLLESIQLFYSVSQQMMGRIGQFSAQMPLCLLKEQKTSCHERLRWWWIVVLTFNNSKSFILRLFIFAVVICWILWKYFPPKFNRSILPCLNKYQMQQ